MQAVRKLSITMLVLTIGFYPVVASAFQAPASGSFAYSVYDLFMNEILTGAIGFTIAAGLVLYAIFWAVRSNVFGTIVCAICARCSGFSRYPAMPWGSLIAPSPLGG